jgi:hypothetical protein
VTSSTDDCSPTGRSGHWSRNGRPRLGHERQRTHHRVADCRDRERPGRQGFHCSRQEAARTRQGANRAPGPVTRYRTLAESFWLSRDRSPTPRPTCS